MISSHLFKEDIKLKAMLASPNEQPRFDWRTVACGGNSSSSATLRVKVRDEDRDFDLGEIADTIGSALTDLMLARQHRDGDIFTSENQSLVRQLSMKVADELHLRAKQTAERIEEQLLILTAQEIYHAIEAVLIRQNAHDVARSLMVRRQRFEVDPA